MKKQYFVDTFIGLFIILLFVIYYSGMKNSLFSGLYNELFNVPFGKGDQSKQSDIFAYVFGLTSGILTLVGLIAIFVSLNSQHTIERGREILWEVQKELLKFKKKGKIDFDDIDNDIDFYEEIINNRGFNFTESIITFAKISLFVVGIIWTLLYINGDFSYASNFIHYTLISSIFVTVLFYVALALLSDIPLVSTLPRINSIIDVKKDSKYVDTLLLAGASIQVKISFSNSTPNISVKFKREFKNIEVDIVCEELSVNVKNDFTNGDFVFKIEKDSLYYIEDSWFKVDTKLVSEFVSHNIDIPNDERDDFIHDELLRLIRDDKTKYDFGFKILLKDMKNKRIILLGLTQEDSYLFDENSRIFPVKVIKCSKFSNEYEYRRVLLMSELI
jgi:hypothetical protein